MSQKEKRSSRNKKNAPSPDECYFSYPIDDDVDEAISMECFECCCVECSSADLGKFHGKINFSLDNLCCDFMSESTYTVNTMKKSKKKKKPKRKIGTPSPIESNNEPEQHAIVYEKPSKSFSPKNFNLDPISDQMKHSSRSFSTNDLSGFRGSNSLRMKKPKVSKKSTKLCSTLKVGAPASFQNLCNRFKSSSLSNLLPITTTDTVKSIVQLSDHDKKILDRMSMKNLKEIALVENAMLARKYWESEKNEREKMRNEQHEKYLRLVDQKRRQEHAELERRKKLLKVKEKEYVEKVQNEIEVKKIRAENILRNIEMEREISECKRRHREYQRMEAIQSQAESHNLDDQIWRESINEKLEERINKAESIRTKNLDVYRVRIQTDNQIHQQMHQQNYEEAVRTEIHKREKLAEKINERDSKFKRFSEHRQKTVQESKAQAHTSALLRELVRRSFGGSFKIPSDSVRVCDNGRFSNCSYTSQVSHIHLS